MQSKSQPHKNVQGCWKLKENKEIQDISQGADTDKFTKSLTLRLYGHTESKSTERMPKTQ